MGKSEALPASPHEARNQKRRRLITLRRLAVVVAIAVVVLAVVEVRRSRREAWATALLEQQGFHVFRGASENSPLNWLRWKVFEPLGFDVTLAAPVTTVTDNGAAERASPVDLRPLLEFPSLKDFSFSKGGSTSPENLNDRLMRPLGALKQLTVIRTGGTSSLTDDFLASLAGHVDLEHLHVNSPFITDAGLQHLAHCNKLTVINLAGCKIRRGLASIPLDRMEILFLSETRIDDIGVECLSRAKQLSILDLSRTNVGDGCFEVLSGLSNLRVVHLKETRVTDEGLRRFRPLSKQCILVVIDTKVTLDEARRVTADRPNLSMAVGMKNDFFIVEAGQSRPSGSNRPAPNEGSGGGP